MSRLLPVLAALAAATFTFAADKKVEDAVSKAESQLAKGRPDDAQKTMEKLVQQVPTAEAHTYRARIQLKAGNVEGAAASAAEAVKQSGSATPEIKADALATLATLDLERGSGQDALTHAQAAVAAASAASTLAVLARAQARLGDPASVETANKAVAAGAQSAAAHEALGHALLAMPRGDEAVAAFRQALTIEPKRASARAGLANALVATGKAAEAVPEAKQATEDNDKSGEAFAAYANALYAAAPKKEAGWNEAINQAQQGAFLSPRNATVLTTVARLFEASGNYDQAATNYRKALEADPGYVPAQLQVLQIESRKGDLGAAITRARELAQAHPQNMDVQLALGRLLARNGDWDAAVLPLGNAAKAMPTSAEVQALAGTVYQYVGQSDDALAAYKTAVQLAPGNNEYRSTYGLLLGLNGRYAEGITELEQVTSAPGYKDAAGWVNLGWLYRKVQPPKPTESAAAYQKALQIDPKNAQAALGLGWAHLIGKQYDEAIAGFNKAIELDPKLTAGEAYNGIGWCHLSKKDCAQARAAAHKAKAAGRNVSALLKGIDDCEKGVLEPINGTPEPPPGDDLTSLGDQLMRGGPGALIAARKLRAMGAPAVPYLLYAAVNARDWGARQASITALGAIGPAARSACGQLAAIARENPHEQIFMTPKQEKDWLAHEDLRRAARAAIAKIGCN